MRGMLVTLVVGIALLIGVAVDIVYETKQNQIDCETKLHGVFIASSKESNQCFVDGKLVKAYHSVPKE